MGLKSNEMLPTKDNILLSIKEDLVKRNESVWYFAHLCNQLDGGCTIALDAKWGYGKTFFVKQTEMLLDAFNDAEIALQKEEKEEIKNSFSNYYNNEEKPFIPMVCIYYDAWLNDNMVDPLVSLVYEILKNSKNNYEFDDKKMPSVLDIAAKIISVYTGKDIDSIINLLKCDNYLEEAIKQDNIHEMIDSMLESLLYERGERLILFIDELDRCRPDFAVQLLEKIKHYFSNERIIFVFSVNINELQHTIKRFYGDQFDAGRYLNRFFDYVIELPPADMTSYYARLNLNTTWVYEIVCKKIIEKYSFGLREIAKFYGTAKAAAFKPAHSNRCYGFPEDYGVLFVTCIIIPLLIGLRIADYESYRKFVDGEDGRPLIDLLSDEETAEYLCRLLLNSNETYDSSLENEKVYVHLSDKLNCVYDTLFVKKTNRHEVSIGECSFNDEIRNHMLKTANLLSNDTLYPL